MTDEDIPLDGSTDTEQPEQQMEKISQPEFRANVRELIDVGFQSGLSPDEIESTLNELADGTQFYFEDLQRYAQTRED